MDERVDALSALLVALFLLCLRFGPAPRLYATMFCCRWPWAVGTWLGNWQWQAHAPWLGWATMNPPFAAGAFTACSTCWSACSPAAAPSPTSLSPADPGPAASLRAAPRRRANSARRVGEGSAGLAGQPNRGHDVRPITLEARAWKPVSV